MAYQHIVGSPEKEWQMNYDQFLMDCLAKKQGEIKICCLCGDDADYSYSELSVDDAAKFECDMTADDFICDRCLTKGSTEQ